MSAPVSPPRVAKRPLEERLSSPRPPSQRKKGASPAKAPRRITPSVEAGVRHVVLGALKASATEAQKEALLAGFRALPDIIPQILHLDCGIDLGLEGVPLGPPPAGCRLPLVDPFSFARRLSFLF